MRGRNQGTSETAGEPDARYRFLSRFGATILSGGIAAIPMSLYHYQAELGLAPQEVWFVGYILAHRWTAALPYPSLRRMSRRTGISTQMLHRYKQSLIEKGYLATIPRHRPSGGRTSNYYDFSGLFGRLEQLLLRDRRGSAWQPTADDPGDDLASLDDHDEAGGDAEAASGAAGPKPPVPVSQQKSARTRPDDGLTWGEVAERVRQRALPDPGDRELTAGEQTALAGAEPSRTTGPALRDDPQERRDTGQRSSPDTGRSLPSQRIETTERRLQNVGRAETSAASPAATKIAGGSESWKRWQAARATLLETISEAAFNAWLASLEVVGAEPTRDGGRSGGGPAMDAAGETQPVVLACASAFQRDHVERRYRDAIEAALGAPVKLVVRPASAARQ